jgi:hypothetical protein
MVAQGQPILRRCITPRAWISISACIQLSGLAFDATWHGLVNPGFEAATLSQMIRHLASVHLLLYIGVVSVLLSTGWALLDQIRRGERGLALPVAFAGAVLSTAGEAWHAYEHLQLSTTHSAAIAGSTAFIGLVIVVAALWASRHEERSRRAADRERRRVA